jgi:hypothetical protein
VLGAESVECGLCLGRRGGLREAGDRSGDVGEHEMPGQAAFLFPYRHAPSLASAMTRCGAERFDLMHPVKEA